MISLEVTQIVVDEEVYVSLIGPLMNLYARVPYAENSVEARWICNQSKLKSLWCATYTLEEVHRCLVEYGGAIIELYADGFDFDMGELYQLREQLNGIEEVTSCLDTDS